jgi:hypothetical protein
MAYAPYQPWDKTYSYSEGQTCTYNGLPYVFWLYGSGVPKSNAGVPPNEEMRLFDAVSFLDGSKESRMERSWVIGEVFVAGQLNDISARYGNIRTLQPVIRGNDASTDYLSSPYNGALYNGVMYGGNRFFPEPLQDPLPPEKQPEESWDFYRSGFAMSVDYKQSGSNGNIVVGTIEQGTTGKTSMPKANYVGNAITVLNVEYIPQPPPPDPLPDPPPPLLVTIDVYNFIQGQGDVATYNCFNRVAHYKILNASGGTVVSGQVSSGPLRDKWRMTDTYPKVRHTFLASDFYRLVTESITPPFNQ